MNERIRELWEKTAESTAAFPSGQNNSWETQVNFLEKFAELIVRQMMFEVVEESIHHLSPDVMKFVGSLADRVHDKFGITE